MTKKQMAEKITKAHFPKGIDQSLLRIKKFILKMMKKSKEQLEYHLVIAYRVLDERGEDHWTISDGCPW